MAHKMMNSAKLISAFSGALALALAAQPVAADQFPQVSSFTPPTPVSTNKGQYNPSIPPGPFTSFGLIDRDGNQWGTYYETPGVLTHVPACCSPGVGSGLLLRQASENTAPGLSQGIESDIQYSLGGPQHYNVCHYVVGSQNTLTGYLAAGLVNGGIAAFRTFRDAATGAMITTQLGAPVPVPALANNTEYTVRTDCVQTSPSVTTISVSVFTVATTPVQVGTTVTFTDSENVSPFYTATPFLTLQNVSSGMGVLQNNGAMPVYAIRTYASAS